MRSPRSQRFFMLIPLLASVCATLSGCGEGSDPLTVLGDPTQTPSLVLPIASDKFLGISSPFDTRQANSLLDGIELSTTSTAEVRAMAPGLVTAVETKADGVSITIMHSQRFVTRLSKLASFTVRIGDSVVSAQKVGTTLTTPSLVHFTVLIDGTPVCPYGYLNTDAKQKLNLSTNVSFLPCQN